MFKEESCKRSISKTGDRPFLKENVKKMCFSGALMPVEALNMPGAVFPLAHRLKHV